MSRYFLVFILQFLLLFSLIGQSLIEEKLFIRATVIEQNRGTLQPVRDFPISIEGIGIFTSDEEGVISFPIQFDDDLEKEISLTVNTTDYQLTQPYDGHIIVDTTHLKTGFEVLLLSRDIEGELQRQISDLHQQLRNLKADNSLSTRRLNAINDSLLQVILIHAQEKIDLEEKINSIKQELTLTKENKSVLEQTVKELKYQLETEQEKNRALQNELMEALAENLRLQTEYLRVITSALNIYLIRAKDLQGTLKIADQYYRGYNINYNKALDEYSAAYLTIYEAHQGYIQNVQNAWQSKKVKTDIEKTFNILINELHDSKILATFDTVNKYIGQRKMKKVAKYSDESYDELSSIIRRLETNVQRLTKTLKKTMK